jgi:hypothetical protein
MKRSLPYFKAPALLEPPIARRDRPDTDQTTIDTARLRRD